MIGIFAYLTICSIRNGVRVRIRQLRQPRYLLMAAGFLLWLGSMMMSRRSSGPFTAIAALHDARARMIAVAVVTLILGTAWVLPVSAGLGFTSAEIQFLFPAPVTRRQLIGYKIMRLLAGAAASGAFLTLLAGPLRLVPGLLFAAKSAAVLGLVTLHGAGVAMYRISATGQGQLPARRWPVVAGACLLTPVVGAALVFLALSSARALAAMLPIAVVLAGANAWWIMRSDSAFEEAATEAAEKMSRARATGHSSPPRISRTRSTPFRLAARGPVETAILWKNWLLLGRASRRALVVSAIVLCSLVAGLAIASGGLFESDLIGGFSMLVVGLSVLLGPMMVRVDLRHDLGHLALLKTWPVRGAAVIRGEVLAPAIALSLCAGLAIIIGSAFAASLPFVEQAAAGARALFATSAMLVITALIAAQLIVHNGIAACFPAWVEARPRDGAAAMEMNGRMMIVTYGALVILAFVVALPAAAAAGAYFVAGGLLIPSAIFAALLLGESIAITEVIGRILDRTDLHDVVVRD